MAPERLGEHKGWQLKKADVWAVAAIVYEMYVGERCFQGANQREVFRNIMSGQWSWPQDRVPSDAMQDLIRLCLDPDAGDRLSAEDALGHSWFEEMDGIDQEGDAIYNSLVSMVDSNPLQDLLAKFSVTEHCLTDAQHVVSMPLS